MLIALCLCNLKVVEWLARYKPKQLAKSGMVRPVVATLCALCAEPDPPEHDNEEQLSAAKFAAQVGLVGICDYRACAREPLRELLQLFWPGPSVRQSCAGKLGF